MFRSSTPTQLTLLVFALSLLGNFQLGYLVSVLNQPYIAIEQFINTSTIERTGQPISTTSLYFIWSALNVANPLAAIFGQLIALTLCNKIGRKNTAIFACLLTFPGILLSLIAKWAHPYYEVLFIGRFIWGIANGIAIVNQTIWIVEAAPTRLRGRVSSWQEVYASLGGLITQALGVPFSTDQLWPALFVMPLFVNLLCLFIFLYLHDSPQYLLINQQNTALARRAIEAYHGTKDEDEILLEMRNCRQSGQKMVTTSVAADEMTNQNNKVNGMAIMFCPCRANDDVSKVFRYGAWIGILVKVAYVFTGARCIRAFNTFIYHDLGHWSLVHAQYGSLFNGLIRLPLTFGPVLLVERLGRRPLLLSTAVASCIALAITMISIHMGESFKIGTMFGVAMLLLVATLGLGSLSRFYAAELVPRKILLKSITVLSIVEAVMKIAIEFTFYPLASTQGSLAIGTFLFPSIIFTILIYYHCPETKSRTINDVLGELARKRGIKVQFET